MKKLLVIVLCFIGISSYAEFTANDSGNLAVVAREVEEIEDNSYPFFALDWANLFATIDAINNSIQNYHPTVAVNTDIMLQEVSSISGNLNFYLPYFDSYFNSIIGEANTISVNAYGILNELYSIREHQFDRLDIPLSDLKPENYKPTLDTTVQQLESINSRIGDIYSDGLNVYLNGDPHVTAHIEDMPDINVDTKDLEDKLTDFNDDFNDYVDSFEGQTVYIQGSPLWSDLNINNEDDFGMSANQNKTGSFFENLMEMISYLHLQNASLNKSSYLIFKNVSGKATEEQREQMEEELNSNITDIQSRMSELRLDIDDTKFNLNFDNNRKKLEIDEIFKQFPSGSNPETVLFYIPSFGDFPAQQINVDITALSSFIEKLRIFVRMSYVILLAFIIWCLYKWLFPLFLFLINFIKKLVSVQ